MSIEIKHKTKALIQYIVCIAVFIAFQVFAGLFERMNLSYFSGVCCVSIWSLSCSGKNQQTKGYHNFNDTAWLVAFEHYSRYSF